MNEHLCEYLQYELSPYPLVLFTEAGMRKTNKSVGLHVLNLVILNWTRISNVTYIIDGFLLLRVIWQQNDTFQCIINIDYIQRHFCDIIVIFDGYNDNTKNIKAME